MPWVFLRRERFPTYSSKGSATTEPQKQINSNSTDLLRKERLARPQERAAAIRGQTSGLVTYEATDVTWTHRSRLHAAKPKFRALTPSIVQKRTSSNSTNTAAKLATPDQRPQRTQDAAPVRHAEQWPSEGHQQLPARHLDFVCIMGSAVWISQSRGHLSRSNLCVQS